MFLVLGLKRRNHLQLTYFYALNWMVKKGGQKDLHCTEERQDKGLQRPQIQRKGGRGKREAEVGREITLGGSLIGSSLFKGLSLFHSTLLF